MSNGNKIQEYTSCVLGSLFLVFVVIGIPFLFGLTLLSSEVEVVLKILLLLMLLAEICILYVCFLGDLLKV